MMLARSSTVGSVVISAPTPWSRRDIRPRPPTRIRRCGDDEPITDDRPDARRFRRAGRHDRVRHSTARLRVALLAGSYVDPKAGRITFADYFDQWSARQ